MPKWLIWTLLELTTFLAIVNILFMWSSYLLKKKIQIKQVEADGGQTPSEHADEPTKSYKQLASFLSKQISYASNAIRPQDKDSHEVNTLKIWGTILKAERAILLNQVSERPKTILGRFLSDLLYALSANKLQNTDPDTLAKNLKETEAEFFQTAELLITKESLAKNQFLLNEDLRKNINRASKRAIQLDSKKRELQRLQAELRDLKAKVKNLETKQITNKDGFNHYLVTAPKNKILDKSTQHASFKQISSLNSLSNRQKMVIEQLRIEVKKASDNPPRQSIDIKKTAVSKLERMSEEFQTIIKQLEGELETSELSIESLKQDIDAKNTKLAALEQQLVNSNETAKENLETLSANKKETLTSLRNTLNTALEGSTTDNLIQQDEDAKTLEHLLHESETCVALLLQELDTAKAANLQLSDKTGTTLGERGNTAPALLGLLVKEREKNRKLAQATTELKKKVSDMPQAKDQQEARASYNKKSLEYDRLQMALSDLEMKYLSTLN
ncbi:hypothetical protein HGG82_01870 [Marinomonas sp. M1K-6]|uniref:Uncharacterized protein n=1 Tax=Marinomonas profundi TaxID=2726122 RepID=A0A847QWC2_9GAMM|nr:hypothetical protein [Marinomonas profundi]NLQ16369.1 hypothetical protein [Marinomonas profundi]UDV03056.1 hypothetical protein J8N69_16125 [Marinomonas profundi]